MGNYRKSILEYNDVRNAVDYAREEGIVRGREEGIVRGREKEKIDIIQKCLQMDFPIEVIVGLTGYSKEQVNYYKVNGTL